MIVINNIIGRQILDSRGNPTVEVDVVLSDGTLGKSCVPSGASKGKYEALELRDKDTKQFHGLGVKKAINHINTEILDVLSGRSPFEQNEIDKSMIDLDGTPNKKRLGANAILGVSLAVCDAAAKSMNVPLWKYIGGINSTYLPVPMMNIINGGSHSNNNLDIQEFMIMPVGFDNFKDALRSGVEIFQSLRTLLSEKGLSTNVGDEGGFAPELNSANEALELISIAIEKTGYKVGEEIYFALDAASTEFYKNGKYYLSQGKDILSSSELMNYWLNLTSKFPILSIEDPFSEDDIDGFINLQAKIGHKLQIVGDDLYVTSSEKLKEGIERKAGNSILIKLNQVGTFTETLNAINIAKESNFNTIISHRSGETEDTFISDLSVGINSEQIKTGSVSRSDRVAKYNQLLRIDEEIGDKSEYFGKKLLKKINKGGIFE